MTWAASTVSGYSSVTMSPISMSSSPAWASRRRILDVAVDGAVVVVPDRLLGMAVWFTCASPNWAASAMASRSRARLTARRTSALSKGGSAKLSDMYQ